MQLVVTIVAAVGNVLIWLIFARAIWSFFPPPRFGSPLLPVYRFLEQVTEPLLDPIRRVLPTLGPLDLSPWAAMILIRLAVGLLTWVLGGA